MRVHGNPNSNPRPKGERMKGWIKIALKRMKAAKNCDHIIGIHYDHSDTDLVAESDGLTTNREERWAAHWVGDIVFFDYCLDCGERLPYKERYKDAVEVVQMP
jgi:hypothetical protein